MKKLKLLLVLALAFFAVGGISAQATYGNYNYYGTAYYYNQPSFQQVQHLYFNQYSLWFGAGAFCTSVPFAGANIDFAFQMPCGCLGGCNASLYANQGLHETGTDYDPVFAEYQQDFAWDYNCSMYYTGPVTEYSDFFGCP